MHQNLRCNVNVSSKSHQRIFNEPAMKYQWFRVYTTKTTMIKEISIEIINVSNISLQKSSTNQRRSSNETSMFWRLAQKNFLSLMFASKSSKPYQRFFIGSSTVNQLCSKGINVLTIITIKTSIIFNVCIQIFRDSSMYLQRVINESSIKKQWNMTVSEINTTKTKKTKKVSIEIINASNMSLQIYINESSTKRHWNINVSDISTKKFVINICIAIIEMLSNILQMINND